VNAAKCRGGSQMKILKWLQHNKSKSDVASGGQIYFQGQKGGRFDTLVLRGAALYKESKESQSDVNPA